MQKFRFWTAIVGESPMTFTAVSAGVRLDIAGWTIM